MTLDLATWTDLFPILRENSAIWSAGLSQELYKHYICRQMSLPWGRKHLSYLVYRHNGTVVSSCKIYKHIFTSPQQSFHIFGIGAVFTQKKYRGNGYAKRMIDEIVQMAKAKDQHGIMLYSDIGQRWYEQLGFEPFSAIDFAIDLEELRLNGAKMAETQPANVQTFTIPINDQTSMKSLGLNSSFPDELLAEMTRHYGRWLRRQPFGLKRSEEYLAFKLRREEFLTRHSSLNWPQKTIWVEREQKQALTYAITEQGSSTLRILEIIGPEKGRQAIWQAIVRFALDRHFKQISGWETVINDFAPSFSLGSLFQKNGRVSLNPSAQQICSSERNWGLPMLLPFTDRLTDWWNYLPCPFLELDHF